MKIDPNHPTIRLIFLILITYCVIATVLNNFIQIDYDYEKTKQEILNAKKSEDLDPIRQKIDKVSKPRFYVLGATMGILFVLYVYYKVQTDTSESTAIFLLMFIGMAGKLIEKIGLDNCLNIPIIDPKGSPGNVLLFDMFYTNFFAYFLDFVYAFAAVIVLSGKENIFHLFKNKKFGKLMKDNLSFFADGKLKYINIIRFLLYVFVIIVFWNWGTIIRPKINLLLHRYMGIPVVDKNTLDLEDTKDEKKDGHELVSTITTIGVISAATVEGLIFTGLLFPMRKYFIYALNNTADYNSNQLSVFIKFLFLVLLIPIFIILMTKYTLTSNDPQEYKYPKMASIILGQYIFIPILLFMGESLFKLPIMSYLKKYQNISMIFFFFVPIIVSLILTLTGKNGVVYIEDNPESEKKVEEYMSDTVTGSCDDSNTKYQLIVAIITLLMTIVAFYPLASIHKLQPLTGIIYFLLICIILRIIYEFHDNYEPYNILNPMRHSKDSTTVDLDSVISLETTMISIFIAVCLLVLFRRLTH